MRIPYSGRSGICDGEFWEEGDREEKPLRPRQESPAGTTKSCFNIRATRNYHWYEPGPASAISEAV